MMDLEVGAVDELLVGEQGEGDKDKGGKPTVGSLPNFATPLFII